MNNNAILRGHNRAMTMTSTRPKTDSLVGASMHLPLNNYVTTEKYKNICGVLPCVVVFVPRVNPEHNIKYYKHKI